MALKEEGASPKDAIPNKTELMKEVSNYMVLLQDLEDLKSTQVHLHAILGATQDKKPQTKQDESIKKCQN